MVFSFMNSNYDTFGDRVSDSKWKILALMVILMIVAFSIHNMMSDRKEVIKVSGAYALYPMMTIWAEEYEKVNPDVVIDISGGGAGKGMADAISGMVHIGMVSRDIYPEEEERGAFYVAVCKDAVVPTINSNNPVLDTLQERGITKDEFVQIFITREISTWGQLSGRSEITDPIRVYTRADACGAAKTWAEYLGDYQQEDLTNNADVAIMHDPDLAEAIKNDRFGIGYNNINFVYDMRSGIPMSGLAIVPVDINGNGTIDDWENFYSTRDDIIDAISQDLYPSPPARDLYLVTKDGFTGASRDFVIWILDEGQQYVSQGGYVTLPQDLIEHQISKMGEVL